MASPLRNKTPPYELPSNIVYFHDWRYVDHGKVGWTTADPKRPALWTTEPIPPLHYEPQLLPVGIRLRCQAARKTEPFLLPRMTDEDFVFSGTVLHDQGCYRLWFDCWPVEHIGDKEHPVGHFNYVRYAESDNGLDWRFPSLGLVERRGSKANNAVYGPPLTPATGYHGGGVFKDESAPAAERYKMIYQGTLSAAMQQRYQRRRPDAVGAFIARRKGPWSGLMGAVSPDGLQWTPLAEVLVAQISDTHNVCEYDPVLGQYVAYCRNWFFNRRTIGRIAADQFADFPLSEEVFWPGTLEQPFEVWYLNAKTRMPGTTDYHLMFPTRWSIADDRFDFFMATSPDNITWNLVPGGPVCTPGASGAWDGGLVGPGLGLVELPDARMGIPLVGSPVPHKHPRRPPLGALAWAWWPRGRLVALEAPVEGRFALWPLSIPQRRVRLNFSTAPSGNIQVQALDGDYQILPGRSFAECDDLEGDHLGRPVTWRGQADLGHRGDGPVVLCFRLRCAELYSVEFE